MKSIFEHKGFKAGMKIIKNEEITPSIDEHDGSILVGDLATIEKICGYEQLINICKNGFLIDEGNDALSFEIPSGYFFEEK